MYHESPTTSNFANRPRWLAPRVVAAHTENWNTTVAFVRAVSMDVAGVVVPSVEQSPHEVACNFYVLSHLCKSCIRPAFESTGTSEMTGEHSDASCSNIKNQKGNFVAHQVYFIWPSHNVSLSCVGLTLRSPIFCFTSQSPKNYLFALPKNIGGWGKTNWKSLSVFSIE